MPREETTRKTRSTTKATASTTRRAPAAPPAPTKKSSKKRRASGQTAAKVGKAKVPTAPTLPSASSLLSDSRQTTEDWYKSSRTKAGYANYVKSGKKWLVDWTAEGRLDDEISGTAFDVISEDTPLALRALTAYKCEHLERGFASAEGLRSAFKDYFERCVKFSGEVGTLMRYLLDELMAYEEGFTDIMMDDRLVDRHETFMGEDATAAVSKTDLVRFEGTLLAKIQGLIDKASSTAVATTVSTPALPVTMPVLPPASVAAEPARSPTPPQFTPRPDRIPQTNTLDDALAYWHNGCAPKGLNTPLKDWTTLFKSSEYTSEAVKLGNIRAVCTEFKIQCRGDHGIFEGKYPGLRKKFTRLMKAVRVERKLRGETKSRNRRN
ncbi:hypothetical protein DFH06DRAFT_1345694 [Mycena polygramma]|nr:hypothetical protein DFH06DRAFT_1345694 [Mycena polygramma]